MKKSNLLLGLLIGLTIFSCSSDDSNNEENPSENLKLIKKITVTQNGTPQSIFSFEYSNNKLISLAEELDNKTEYNYSGNQLNYERRLEYNFGTSSYDSEYERTDFEYQNNILESDLVTENGNQIQKHDYALNSNGKMTRYDFYNFFNNQWNSGGSRLFEYISGNITEEIQTDNNDDIVFKHQYTYDDKKHPLINVDIQVRRQIWGYRLNSMNENNILSYSTYDMNDNLQSSYTYSYQYDSDGYPTEREKLESGTDQVIETIIYEYE
jgi:hypothetical protein